MNTPASKGWILSARQALISAAERLFAERGIPAVSMREVATAAGQGNTSAVRYHFGSRDGLVDAIFTYRMARIDERRRAFLAARPDAHDDPRFLLEALVFPLAESIGHEDGESWYARFLAQVAFQPGFDSFSGARREVTRGLEVVVDGLRRRVEGLEPPLGDLRITRVMQVVIHGLAEHEAAMARGAAVLPTSALAADLVDGAAAVLAAPVSSLTLAELTRSRLKGA